VDDVRNSINQFEDNSVSMEDLCSRATRDCQLWHDLLWVVNQKLELPKCGYHAIQYEFQPTGELKLLNAPETRLILQDPQGNPIQIQQWPNDKAAQGASLLTQWGNITGWYRAYTQ
jgi:hypothetical protein